MRQADSAESSAIFARLTRFIFRSNPLTSYSSADAQIVYPSSVSYILGFDGGGTKTECVLMDTSDHVIARAFAGPSNPTRIGVEAAVRSVQEAANLCLREAGLDLSAIAAIGAGLAGTASPEMRERTRAAMEASFPGIHVVLLTDLEAALAAAGEAPVIVLVAGTGSASIGRNARNEVVRAGGWGPQSSDHGSAFDVGRRVIAAATKSHTDTGAPSTLEAQILAHLVCTSWSEVQRRAEAAPDDVFPRIFPVIAEAADAGDAAVREILLSAVAELLSLVKEVVDRLDLHHKEFRLAKTGGMFGRSVFFDAQFDAATKKTLPRAQLGSLRISPAEAAALAARC
jgi:N-acetylglucosamine kinase-like BadF-type ATPase